MAYFLRIDIALCGEYSNVPALTRILAVESKLWKLETTCLQLTMRWRGVSKLSSVVEGSADASNRIEVV